MPVSLDHLREMNTGVYLVTTRAQDRINGLTVSWATRVSLDPPLVGVAVDKRWYSHELLSEGTDFVINILADDQVQLARHFGSTSGRTHDKLKNIDWEKGKTGIPLIRGCKAWLECRKENQVSTGDHTFFIGQVISTRSNDQKKKLTYDRKKLYEK